MMDEEFQIPKDTNGAEEPFLSQSWKRLVEGYMSSTKPFSFDTIDDFDKHIAQSIPNYHLLTDSIKDISTFFFRTDTTIVDLGCSTGKLLESIPSNQDKLGIDLSMNLLPDSHNNILYIPKDIRAFETYGNSSLILSIFTLQFIPYEDRAGILETVYKSLIRGGGFIWAEKVVEETGDLERIMNSAHYDFKRKSFTASEILDKELDIRSMMSLNTSLENQVLAEEAGFERGTMFWKHFNFEAWLYIK